MIRLMGRERREEDQDVKDTDGWKKKIILPL
jgi:hypothetical protein